MVVADGLYGESGYGFEAMVRIDKKWKTYNFVKYPITIKVTDKESNEVMVLDILGFKDLTYSEDQIRRLKKFTDETMLM